MKPKPTRELRSSIVINSFCKGGVVYRSDVMGKSRYTVEIKFHRDYIEVEGNNIRAGLLSKPERGRANMELIRKLAKFFKIPSSQIKIISGQRSRRKIIEIIHE